MTSPELTDVGERDRQQAGIAALLSLARGETTNPARMSMQESVTSRTERGSRDAEQYGRQGEVDKLLPTVSVIIPTLTGSRILLRLSRHCSEIRPPL